MTQAQRNAQLSRALYLSSKDIEFIANLLGVTPRTIANYKARALSDGDDWDRLKIERHLSSVHRDKESLFSDFVALMYDELHTIKEDTNLTTKQRIEAISKLGDSFSKMRRIANSENPEAFTRTIIKKSIASLIAIIQPHISQECLAIIIEQIEQNQQRLADVTL